MKTNSAESKVRKILKELGFILSSQKDERTNGVDIVAMKKGKVLLIEVKKAKYHKRAWQVTNVSNKQKVVCDTIAIVFPDGTISLSPMSEHLKLCSKSGVRYLTEYYKLTQLL